MAAFSAVSFQQGASYNVLDGFAIAGCGRYGVTMAGDGSHAGADHNTVRNGTITGWRGFAGIEEEGSCNTYENVSLFAPSGGTPVYDANGVLVNVLDGDGMRINYSRNATVRHCSFHPIFQLYSPLQHTDCIQTYVDVQGAVVENCLIGTWQPDGVPGQGNFGSQNMLMLEATTASPVEMTFRNNVFLGMLYYTTTMAQGTQPGSVTLRFLNNTFYSGVPMVSGGPTCSLTFENNAFYRTPGYMDGTAYLRPGYLLSDYNAYYGSVPAFDGPHSFSVAGNFGFAGNSDITAASDWGGNTD